VGEWRVQFEDILMSLWDIQGRSLRINKSSVIKGTLGVLSLVVKWSKEQSVEAEEKEQLKRK
jgi:hypothetical protein